MKFAGLILICASSCLALILPAIGVVKFPQVPQSQGATPVLVNHIGSSFPGASSDLTNNAPPLWSSGPTNSLPQSPIPSFQETPNAIAPAIANPFDANASNASPNKNFQLGMGIWLLLLPVCLLGLAMWTFGPNPSEGKKR